MPTLPLTVYRAVEFMAMHQPGDDGLESRPHHHNYSGWVGVTEPMTRAELQTKTDRALQRYSNQNLNTQLNLEPTLVNLIQSLWDDIGSRLPLTSVELTEDSGPTARITNNHLTLIYPGQFSAAHRTYAPRLSEAQNRALYGKCVNLHGHNYRAEVALPPHIQLSAQLWDEFDHVNLSADIPDLGGRNVVTEAMAELIARRAPQAKWVRVWELPDFFAEYHRVDSAHARYRLGRHHTFRAADGLVTLEVTVQGELDPHTETAYDLGQLDSHCLAVIQKLDYTSSGQPNLGEGLTRYLWTQLAERLGQSLMTVRLWATRHEPATRHEQFSLGR